MSMLPEDIINKIMLFNSHPVADIMKESSIFKYLQLREIYVENAEHGLITNINAAFSLGCDDGFDNDYDVNQLLHFAIDGDFEWDELDDAVISYDIGFIHTLYKLNDDDEFDF